MDTQRILVTVVGPTGRADLAVPGQIPAALALPLLLGELKIKASAEDAAWEVAQLDGRVVEADASLADCGVADGDLLFLRRIGYGDPVRYDDVAEIIAEEGTQGRWRPAYTGIAAGATGAVLTLIVLAGAATRLAPPSRAAACGTLLGALVAGVIAARRHRTMRAHGSVMLALASVSAAVTANALVGGRPDGVGLLAGAAALGACSVAGIAVGRHAVVGYAGLSVATFGGIAAIAVLVGGRIVSAGAICGAVAVASLLCAPALALRLSGVTTFGRDAGEACDGVAAESARASVRRADRALLGILCGAAAGVLGAVILLACSRDPAAAGLALVLALLTVIRSRSYRDRSHVGVLAGAGLCAVAVTSVGPGLFGGWSLAVTSVLATACFVVVWAICSRWPGYRVQRVIDVVDAALMCVLLPAVLMVGGAYGAILSLWD